MAAPRYTLGAGERLKREQHIQALFRTGKALSFFPLRIFWMLVLREKEAKPIRAGFSAPKKRFRHAADRNRIKRLLREAWRLQKPALIPHIPEGRQLHLFLLYTGSEMPEWPLVCTCMQKSILHLQKTIEANDA